MREIWDRTGISASLPIEFNKDNIGTNLLNILIADNEVGAALKKIPEVEAFGNSNLADMAGAFIKFYIDDIAKLLAVADIDNFFFLKIGKQHRKDSFSFQDMSFRRKVCVHCTLLRECCVCKIGLERKSDCAVFLKWLTQMSFYLYNKHKRNVPGRKKDEMSVLWS